MKNLLIVIFALSAGLVGGFLGSQITRRMEQRRASDLIRAKAFELVDADGDVLSYWGVDKLHDVVLAFRRDDWPRNQAGENAIQPHGGLDDSAQQRMMIGMESGNLPMLRLTGADGRTRVRLYLYPDFRRNTEGPLLLLEDPTGPRVSLGSITTDTGDVTNDWALKFGQDCAAIGMAEHKEEAHINLRGFLVPKNNQLYCSP